MSSGNHHRPGPSQRQLRAGELIRHTVAEILQRGEVHARDLPDRPVTVTEVAVAPDLRNATVYVSVLGKDEFEAEIDQLNRAAPAFRQILGRKIALKFTPSLTFRPDQRFGEAARIDELLKDVRQRD